MLAAHAHEPNAFMQRWFAAPSLAHCDGNGGARLVFAMRGTGAIAAFLLVDRRLYGAIPMAHVASWRHPNMFLGGAMIVAGEEQAAWRALFAALTSQGRHYLVFGPLDRDGAMARGLERAAREAGHGCRLVRSEQRALLVAAGCAADYWDRAVRGKKRKELRRQERRLGELGALAFETLSDTDEMAGWCDAFLALEQAGWKGREGSALACSPTTQAMFRSVLAEAWAAGALSFSRLTLDGRPIAMLTTLLDGTAGFSFKTTYDEALAAYSPGVLLQRHNLDVVEALGLAWVDSCAAPGHPMIDSLWTERRRLGWYALSLSGGWHRRAFDAIHRLKEVKHGLTRAGEPKP